MLLVIDSGNTNIVFAVYDGEKAMGEWRSSTRSDCTADEYGVWLTQLMQLKGLNPQDISAAVMASVVPANVFALKTLCRTYFHTEPLVIGEPGVRLDLQIMLDRPEEVGADRLVNAIAAHTRYKGSLVVIDFGTATTFDVVDRQGNYHGGCICPGINLSLEALHMAAAQLPRVAVGRPLSVIGKATVPAMKSGVYWGYVGLIEGLVSRISKEFGEPMTVVATGGLAPLFAEATDVIHHLDSDLTLRGLVEIYRRNITEEKLKRA
ncbi:type III pantothenate kinase [Haematospirillum jordaniae]|uniref:Type III pantothenate kinase n=1 Tax=Haematospirillum jordaniae TaxID=1549855 RepID=A0A143DEZ2_9PROT|nr:type III pantothenate kinase [Haematospirillum jordaniae]AMW35236.1 type III pantothenate kinase [Haematospirillum jordaniae]NKD45608.1 type III pantothenate kinase [Haematospirillum jordaniae]NKD56361.1 type III pantothenate kinase [Haematospirillum jordaniae]NKD58419.1 type III pantothenate kinase [Haematospirillum jordaniae]NKD66412.1 type III pantothenate kinase [Haematospirillum jordaniae]